MLEKLAHWAGDREAGQDHLAMAQRAVSRETEQDLGT